MKLFEIETDKNETFVKHIIDGKLANKTAGPVHIGHRIQIDKYNDDMMGGYTPLVKYTAKLEIVPDVYIQCNVILYQATPGGRLASLGSYFPGQPFMWCLTHYKAIEDWLPSSHKTRRKSESALSLIDDIKQVGYKEIDIIKGIADRRLTLLSNDFMNAVVNSEHATQIVSPETLAYTLKALSGPAE